MRRREETCEGCEREARCSRQRPKTERGETKDRAGRDKRQIAERRDPVCCPGHRAQNSPTFRATKSWRTLRPCTRHPACARREEVGRRQCGHEWKVGRTGEREIKTLHTKPTTQPTRKNKGHTRAQAHARTPAGAHMFARLLVRCAHF